MFLPSGIMTLNNKQKVSFLCHLCFPAVCFLLFNHFTNIKFQRRDRKMGYVIKDDFMKNKKNNLNENRRNNNNEYSINIYNDV